MRSAERRKENVLDMKCLRSVVGMPRMDRVRNEEVGMLMRAGIARELASRADQRVLRWVGHVERMDEYHIARRVLMAEVSEVLVRGRQRLGWTDGAKRNRGTTFLCCLGQQRNNGRGCATMIGKSREPCYISN